MNIITLKRTVGTISLLSHFTSILFVFIAGYRRDELSNAYDLSIVLAPITSVYSATFLRDVVANQTNFDQTYLRQKVHDFSFYMQTAIVSMFSLCLLLCTGSLIWVRTLEFTQIKTVIVIIESVFGIFLGLIFESLFGKLHHDQRKTEG
jgi:hypothetical protein